MEFEEILAQVIALLQRQGRVSYGALKRRFALDDDYLEDLKTELIEAQRLAVDENSRILSGLESQALRRCWLHHQAQTQPRRPLPTPRRIWQRRFLPPAPPWQANANR
jgi:hypothetical protein